MNGFYTPSIVPDQCSYPHLGKMFSIVVDKEAGCQTGQLAYSLQVLNARECPIL